MISYAQNFEDVILARVFGQRPSGFYVDVGANHPEIDSVSRHFYGLGWRGINIEPGTIFEALRAARPEDVNLNVAASDISGKATFYEVPDAHGLSRLNSPNLGLTNTIPREVPTVPLREILAEHGSDKPIDFLSIDVEGHEQQVLNGNDWVRFRPQVVLVEATLPNSQQPAHENWEPILRQADYEFAYFDGLNRFYVPREKGELVERFNLPPNVFDGFVRAEVVRLQQRLAEVERQLATAHSERNAWENRWANLTELIGDPDQLPARICPGTARWGLWLAERLSRCKRILGH